MKLTDLGPQFLTIETFQGDEPGKEPEVLLHHVEAIDEAQGIGFLCPFCFAKNGGPEGTHHVLVWFVGRVKDDVKPEGRWVASGTGYDDLTLVPNIQVTEGCLWHGHVERGEAR